MLSLTSLSLSLVLLSLVHGQNIDPTIDPATVPSLWSFKSRPGLNPEKLVVNTSMDGTVPGYIFTAPYQCYQNTAIIYDMDGEVVWFGFGQTGAGNVHNFHVCQYNDTPTLCWIEGIQYLGYSAGSIYFADTDLKLTKSFQSLDGYRGLDQHELNTIGDSLIFDIYQPVRYDLSDYNVSTGQGWVMDCTVQTVNMTTGELIFQWSALDHIALSESFVLPNSTNVAGSGLNPASPWDYAHLNAMDINSDGDYLISSRHTSTLFKVNGQTGEIIWRCGGSLSDFEFLDGLNFSSQHDARWVSTNSSTDIISLFDNASDGYNSTANHSTGYIIKLDHSATPPTASLLRSYPAPPDQPISSSQGNLQILNMDDYLNSNVFISWGSQPAVTQHDSDGNILYYAYINASGPMIYRSSLSNITITPDDSPALYTYAQSTNDDTVYYMSWNGATEVDSYNVYGRSSCDSNFTLIGNVRRTGFETNYTAKGYQEFGMIEAVYANGTGIRNTTSRGTKAFVPSQALSQYCSGDECQPASQYVVAAGNASAVPETRSACDQQPVQTASSAVASSSSSSSSSKANAGSQLQPTSLAAIRVSLLTTILLGTAGML